MQVTKSKPIGKPDDTPAKDKPPRDQERPTEGTDVESERSFHESNKRSDPDPDIAKHGAT